MDRATRVVCETLSTSPPSSNVPPPPPAGTSRCRAMAEPAHLGIKSGQLLNLLPHLFSLLHSKPAPGVGAKTGFGWA